MKNMANPYLDLNYGQSVRESVVNKVVVPFVGCGDLSATNSTPSAGFTSSTTSLFF